MNLSIVTTLYRSEKFIETFLDKAIAAGEAFGGEFEILVVDDGSPDKSRELAEARAKADPRIVVIELARNFGHHAALWCGLHTARGENVFLIDSDLEVSPSSLLDFARVQRETKSDVVYGVQEARAGGLVSNALGSLFWRLFNLTSDTPVPNNVMTERLMTRRYLDGLLQLGDRNLFLGGMFYWPGYKQTPISLMKQVRKGGSYSYFRRLVLLVRAISSFSSAPLLMIFWVGLLVAILSSIYAIYVVTIRLVAPESVLSGFAILAIFSAFSFGANLMGIGMLGLYVHRVFRQVQNRPIYIIRRTSREAEG